MEEEKRLEGLPLLREKVDNIKTNKLLMSQNTILSLLRSIVDDSLLIQILKTSNENVDYAEEYKKACNLLPSGNIFNLPTNPKKIVSLVTGLLYEFAEGTVSISKFLKDFFPAENTTESFDKFCEDVFTVYVRAFKDVKEGRYEDDLKIDENIINEPIKMNIPQISDVVKEQINPYLRLIHESVLENDNIEEKDREDILYVMQGLNYAIDVFNAKIVATIWIGFKSMMAKVDTTKSYITAVDDILKTYGVLEA